MKAMTWLAVPLAVALAATDAGCGQDLFGSPRSATAAGHVTLTERATASALVAVAGGGAANGQLLRIVGATAQPLEHLDIVVPRSGTPLTIAAAAPPPAMVEIPARPSPPPGGATSYQQAAYQRQRARWNGQVAAGQHAVATRTALATAAWVRPLLARAAAVDGAASGNLVTGSALAASVLSGIADEAGTRFAGRVVLLSVASLQGMPPPGELDGDDVVVLTPFLPAESTAAAAQQDLLAAGAARAAVLGPEATQAQLDQLVTDGLTARQLTETVSGPALFANDSMALLPAAARVLTPLLAQLRRPGVTAVINGYASVPGTPGHNIALSQGRAEAVARFLEANHVSTAALSVVGHGAANLVGSGSSGDNRRVVVVIEEPA
jgi:outer membrane protein OmpA-like peptidoglycan-associated protein